MWKIRVRATVLNWDHIYPDSHPLWKNYAYGVCGWTETTTGWALPHCNSVTQARVEGAKETGCLSDPSAHKSVYWDQQLESRGSHEILQCYLIPAALQKALVRQTLPPAAPTQVTPCRWQVTRGQVVPGCTVCLGHGISTSFRPDSTQQAVKDLPQRQDRCAFHNRQCNDRHSTPTGKRAQSNHSATTAQSLLAWLECKAGINPGIVLETNRIWKAGTHLSPQSVPFHSRAVSIMFAYIQSFALPHLSWLHFYTEKLNFNVFL